MLGIARLGRPKLGSSAAAVPELHPIWSTLIKQLSDTWPDFRPISLRTQPLSVISCYVLQSRYKIMILYFSIVLRWLARL